MIDDAAVTTNAAHVEDLLERDFGEILCGVIRDGCTKLHIPIAKLNARN
jgi:hypothetical protein